MNLNKIDKWELLMLTLSTTYTSNFLSSYFEMPPEYIEQEVMKIKAKLNGIKSPPNIHLRAQVLINYDKLINYEYDKKSNLKICKTKPQ